MKAGYPKGMIHGGSTAELQVLLTKDINSTLASSTGNGMQSSNGFKVVGNHHAAPNPPGGGGLTSSSLLPWREMTTAVQSSGGVPPPPSAPFMRGPAASASLAASSATSQSTASPHAGMMSSVASAYSPAPRPKENGGTGSNGTNSTSNNSHTSSSGGNSASSNSIGSPFLTTPGSSLAFASSTPGLSVAASYSQSQGPSQSVLLSLFSAALYGTVGLAMGFINKAVLMIWPYSNSLLMFQMAASVAIIYLATLLSLVETRPLTVRAAASLWGVVFFYNANVAFALAAVQALSIPVYHVLKRLTPVMVLLTKIAMGEPPPPPQVTMAVCTVVLGCFLSGAGDLSFDIQGYTCAIISCILQSAYLIFVERSGGDKGFTSSELMVYNAILSLPVLMLLTLVTGEAFKSVPALVDLAIDPTSSSFLWTFVVSLVAGVLLNYSLFLCTLCNTALTTTIVGALRSVLGTILGFFLLGGVKATVLIVVGAGVNTFGGVWYTVAKTRQKFLASAANPSKSHHQQSKAQVEESMPLVKPSTAI